MTKSESINNAIRLSLQHNNSIKNISYSWSKIDVVVFFTGGLTQELKDEISKTEPSLRFYSTTRNPHYDADEGFISDIDSVAISFPR